ncbi:MAG TPA: PEGA domain-containing protein [Vicinamibacterales bacterium]|nr:PEGA domain-containing protein [Vicinamibacterales bacterium]HOQ59790.1 PEGA domain-containing protein [Vicinamibacterales bacterium]
MRPTLIVTSAVVAVALGLAAAPALAQGRGAQARQRDAARSAPSVSAPRSDGSRQQSGRQAVARGTERRQSASVQNLPRATTAQRQAGAIYSAPRGSAGRQQAGGQPASRSYQSGQATGLRTAPRAIPGASTQGYRSDAGRVYDQRRGGAYGARGYASYNRIIRYDGRRYARPRTFVPYRPYYFSRSYYAFRPRLNIGFGLWLGYSVRYPWSWYYGGYAPRVYGYGYGYGYVPGQVYYADRGPDYYGGLSFDIEPSDADLYIDGEYVGEVGQFSPYGEPLTLVPGVHRIAIVRDGYMTLEWDVEVEAGMVLPYHGVMEPW